MRRASGFTLLEILIALFIFTILSMILVSALHNVIGISATTKHHAEQLRRTQMALLIIKRDIEQALDRPIINASGRQEAALVGAPQRIVFTHTGLANPSDLLRSVFQRTSYEYREQGLWRVIWPVLDQAPQTESHERLILEEVESARFEFLDKDGRFQSGWPVPGQQEVLPKAIRLTFTLKGWGNISQLYIIPAQSIKAEINAAQQESSANE